MLDLTRIIAGPICGRALAAYGADVMLVNSPNLPNIDNIIDTSRGKLSVFADLDTADGRIALGNLLRSAHVFVQGYRPGAMAARGFGPQDAARIRPGIVYVSLSAYGEHGPWARRRGFDSLVQTASGFNHAEAQAAGQPTPKPLPMQILDHASGYLMAFAAQAALARQATGAAAGMCACRWRRPRTGCGLGRIEGGLATPMPAIDAYLQTEASGFGELVALRHAAQFSRTPARWTAVLSAGHASHGLALGLAWPYGAGLPCGGQIRSALAGLPLAQRAQRVGDMVLGAHVGVRIQHLAGRRNHIGHALGHLGPAVVPRRRIS